MVPWSKAGAGAATCALALPRCVPGVVTGDSSWVVGPGDGWNCGGLGQASITPQARVHSRTALRKMRVAFITIREEQAWENLEPRAPRPWRGRRARPLGLGNDARCSWEGGGPVLCGFALRRLSTVVGPSRGVSLMG